MTTSTNPDNGTPRFVPVVDGLLFVVDTLVVAIVIGGLVGLFAGGTQHQLYQLTIGLIYGWVTSPGVSGIEILVYMLLLLAVSGPVWHSKLRSHYIATSGEFEFGRETGSDNSTEDLDVLPYSDGGALRPNGKPTSSNSEWSEMVFDGEEAAKSRSRGDFYRSSGRSSPRPQSKPLTLNETDVDRTPADVDEIERDDDEDPEIMEISNTEKEEDSAPATPEEASDPPRGPSERLNESIATARTHIEAVSQNITENDTSTDLSTLEARFESIRSETTDRIDALEDAVPSNQRDLEQEVTSLREEERTFKNSISASLDQ